MKKSKQAGKYILSDFISASVAWLLFNILRYEVFAIDEGADSLLDYLQYPGVLGGQVVIPLFWLVLYYFSGYYNKPFGKSRLTELFSTFITVLIGTVFVFFALLLDDIPRSIDIYYKLFFGMFGLQFFITYIPRLLITQSGMRKIKNREWAMKVLIIGAGGKAVRIAHDLYRLGYDICGFVSEDERTPVKADRNQVLGTVEDIPVLMEKENVDEIVLAVESKNNKALLGILYSLYRYKRPIKVLADRFNMLSKIQLRTIRGIPLVDVTDNNFSPAEQNIKLFLDKVCSVVALLLLSPLFAYIAWRGKKESPGARVFPPGADRLSRTAVLDVQVPHHVCQCRRERPVAFVGRRPACNAVRTYHAEIPVGRIAAVLERAERGYVAGRTAPRTEIFYRRDRENGSLLLSVAQCPSGHYLVGDGEVRLCGKCGQNGGAYGI